MRILAVALAGLVTTALVATAKGPRLHHQNLPAESPILARYDFEQVVPAGPDTIWVRQSGDGEVALSRAFRVSGERSLHVSEVPGNRDFAEFLAYFRDTRDGAVFIQFYLLLTDPEQRFNFGLAGEKWFLSTERHGQAIWLQSDEGYLRHRTARGWRRLFAPTPFTWYFVDLVYHVDLGSYDLALYQENDSQPMVDLRKVPSMNGHGDSAVRYFSLIGDLEDAGRFDFFVDDLTIATDPAVLQEPFVAPGRRGWFVDSMAVGRVEPRSERQRDLLFHWARETLHDPEWDPSERALDRLEKAGDQAFRAGELRLSRRIYERLRLEPRRTARILLKLADVLYLEGDYEGERTLRERIYGRLRLEP